MDNAQITSGEASRLLGVSPALIRKLEHIGVTPPARRIGRFRIYNSGEVEGLRRIIADRRASQRSRRRREDVAA